MIKWGILSTARINDLVLEACRDSDLLRFVSIASRELSRAQDYARRHGIPRAYGSYDELLADSAVDAIYIPLPNGLHIEWTIKALEAGKHVLCEKPLSRSPQSVAEAFDTADSNHLILAEALMYRYHPQTKLILDLVRDGTIGPLAFIHSKHSFVMRNAETDFRSSSALEGGALMDLGCYCVSTARLLAGEPDFVNGRGVFMPSGVDMRFYGTLGFPNGVTATFDCAMDLPDRAGLEIVGSLGEILVPDPWRCEQPGFSVRSSDGKETNVPVPTANRYRIEFEEFSTAISRRAGLPFGREDAVAQAGVLNSLTVAAKQDFKR